MDAAGAIRPTRVLVVDDESFIRTFAERVLHAEGYAVDTAPDGPEALRIVEQEGPFDLFVIDVFMPKMRGHKLASQLRRRYPDAKVLYFTAYADLLLREKHVLWENEALLEKPVTVGMLRKAVSLLLFEHTRGLKRNPPDDLQ
jgi:CheY-like chemotaxis protein